MIHPEFSRLVPVDRLGPKEKSFTIEANATERKALAKRLGVPEVVAVRADLGLRLAQGGRIVLLKGRLKAELVQNCVVTLEPVRSRVDEEFSRTYSIEGGRGPAEVVIDLEEEEPPEPVENGQIDMGEAAAEHLALAMDPFPRAPGVSFEPPPETAPPDASERERKPNPFEVLAEHRKKV
jgi:uncharacterized metal-binding protein YceD (DUF177 family)